MANKNNKPETQAVLTRLSKETFRRLRAEALLAKRSIGSQLAFTLELLYSQTEPRQAERKPQP